MRGDGVHQVEVTVNGALRRAEVPAETTLLSALRDSWGLTGSKLGCDVGDCGACTGLVDGLSVNSCLLFVVQVDGREGVTTGGLPAPRSTQKEKGGAPPHPPEAPPAPPLPLVVSDSLPAVPALTPEVNK